MAILTLSESGALKSTTGLLDAEGVQRAITSGEAVGQIRLLGYRDSQLSYLDPPADDVLASARLREVVEDEPALPSPIWNVAADVAAEDPSLVEQEDLLALTADWVRTVRPECGPSLEAQPFGAALQFLPAGRLDPDGNDNRARRLNRVVALGEDRIVAVGRHDLFLFERGGTFDVNRGTEQRLRLDGFVGEDGPMVLDPDPRPDGRRTIWVATRGGGSGALVEVAVGANGFELIGTATAAMEMPQPHALAADGSGNIFVGGVGGYVAVKRVGTNVLETLSIDSPELLGATLRKLAATEDPTAPHIVVSDGPMVFRGDLFSNVWTSAEFGGINERPLSIAASAEGEDVWVGGEHGFLRRSLSGGDWAPPEPFFPDDFVACTSLLIDRTTITEDVIGLAIDDTDLYLLPHKCNSALKVRRSDGCARAIVPAGMDVALGVDGELRTLALTPSGLLIAGDKGTVLYLERQ